jgi:uncharacterized protein
MSGASLCPIDPWRACRRGLSFSGVVALGDMPRLAEAVLGLGRVVEQQGSGDDAAAGEGLDASTADGAALYELRFERDRQGIAIVTGCVRALLRLQCQRCLDAVEIPVDIPIELALIRRDEDAPELPDHLDPWLVTDERLNPVDVVEEELLLAIPTIPRHSRACGAAPAGDALRPSPGDADAEQDERRRPFAVLADLMPRSDNRGDDG